MTSDERVMQGILRQLETAWNRYDSVSFAAAFAEDANFIHIFGGQLDGRAAIEAAHRHIFETIYRGSHASFVLRSIRFLRRISLSQKTVYKILAGVPVRRHTLSSFRQTVDQALATRKRTRSAYFRPETR